jgi:hypothetical protein
MKRAGFLHRSRPDDDDQELDPALEHRGAARRGGGV